MAFENVIIRHQDGSQHGPVPMGQLVQWYNEGRVPADAVLVDPTTQEARPLTAFSELAWPPPAPQAYAPPQPPPITQADHLIPTKNPKALIAYYLGLFSLICGIILGPIAIVLGVMGVRDAKTLQVGRTHAIVGIVGGTFATLLWLIPMILIAISNMTH